MSEGIANIFIGVIVWGVIFLCFWLLRPSSAGIRTPMGEIGKLGKAVAVAVMALEIGVCAYVMTLSPAYNGENPKYTNQYELIADSFLQGKLYIDYDDVDPKLEKIDNPYDPDERRAVKAKYHWDHAYYKGHYYMYFGVVPALLLFVPFKALTGATLTTYHATQLFVTAVIIGFFALFYRLSRKRFPRMPVGVYIALSVALSGVSLWYVVEAPALYCTAIAAGLCFMVWCLFLFLCSFDVEAPFKRTIGCAIGGAVCGALAFGCRPTIAFANLVVIVMLVRCLQICRLTKRQIAALFVAGLIPYILVAVGLCAYNYARFDNCLEFGQAYQLTVADQHDYGLSLSRVDLVAGVPSLVKALFTAHMPSSEFPHVRFGGLFYMFPVLLVGCLLLLYPKVWHGLKRFPIESAMGKSLPLVALLIIVLDLFMSPYWIDRYAMDVNWMFAIAGFISYGMLGECVSEERRPLLGTVAGAVAIITTVACVLFFLVPNDYNVTHVYPEALEQVAHIVTFGLE